MQLLQAILQFDHYCTFKKQKMGGQSISLDMISNLLGEGSYSWVYSLRCGESAIKIAKFSQDSLEEEYNIMQKLSKSNPSLFITVERMGSLEVNSSMQRQKLQLQYFTLQKKGVSLSELMNLRGKLKVSTISHICKQLLAQMQYLSKLEIVHNDIKPSNILFGTAQQRSKVFLIDFGMAHQINTPKKTKDGFFRGNIPFASTRRLKGESANIFDDIESIVYLALWVLMDGNLPWLHLDGAKSANEAIQQTIQQRKQFVHQFKMSNALSSDKRQELMKKLALISELFEGQSLSKITLPQLLNELNSYFS